MEPRIQYAQTKDGVGIAHGTPVHIERHLSVAPFTSACGTNGLPSALRPHLPEDVPLLRVAPHRLLELGDDARGDLAGVLFGAQAAGGEGGGAGGGGGTGPPPR